ncbi:hypothetical protein YC2023_030310 [Brassica napus]
MVGLAIFWEAVDPLSPSSPAYGLREGMAPIVSFFVGFSSGQFGCSRFTLLIFSSPIVSWNAFVTASTGNIKKFSLPQGQGELCHDMMYVSGIPVVSSCIYLL